MPSSVPGFTDAPVTFIEPDKGWTGPQEGVVLCLSGGGYRAMLFHAGALMRLNEVGLLKDLRRVSSVSGGSIAAGVLGLKWKKLGFDGNNVATNLHSEVIDPIRNLASRTIDVGSVLKGLLLPGTISEKIAGAYDKHLFHGATLQDLPGDGEGPRFVMNATNVQTGALWRFSKPYMADYLVGMVPNPTVRLAVAVGASSAFPPVLSPVRLGIDPKDFKTDPKCPLQREPFTSRVVLSDGGVYDNLGLETAWKNYRTVLVSDGGGKMPPDPRPKRDWLRHSLRVLDVIDNQVRSLRKRQLIASYEAPSGPFKRAGSYWGIRSNIANYGTPCALPCPEDRTMELADTPTRLAELPPERQERLINWGYAVCDAAIRKHVDSALPPPSGFPYPAAAV